ncbi:MAG: hypothetical protein ACRCX2_03615 [Paraclostridium sp.]
MKLLKYDFVDIDNKMLVGKAFKCVFSDEVVKEYTQYFTTLRDFIENVRGCTDDEKVKDVIERADLRIYSDELLDKKLVSWK